MPAAGPKAAACDRGDGDGVGEGAARAATATGSGLAGAAGAATVSVQWRGGSDGELDQPDGVGARLGGDGDEEQKASGREETDGFWRKLLSVVYIRRALVPVCDSNRE